MEIAKVRHDRECNNAQMLCFYGTDDANKKYRQYMALRDGLIRRMERIELKAALYESRTYYYKEKYDELETLMASLDEESFGSWTQDITASAE